MSCSVTEQYEKHYPKNEHHDCSGMHPAKKRNEAMKLLDRYIFRQFAASFLFASITFAALFTLITLVENLDDFFDRGVGISGIAWYYMLALPSTFQITAPVATLLASILTAGRLSASSELAAIRSAGASMSQLMRPYVLGGLLISGINLLNASFLEPAAAKEKISFEKQVLNQTRSGLHEGGNIHVIEPDNRIVTIESFDAKRLLASKVTIEQFSGSRLISRKDASRMLFDPAIDRWILQKAAIRSFGADPGEISFSTGNDTLNLLLSMQSLQELSLQPEEMNLIQHYQYVKEKMQAGFPGLDRARVKLHAKTALPLASLVIIFIGVPLSTVKKRSGLAAEIAIALFIGFLFLGMQKTVASLGYNGIIEPWIAAWLPIFLFIGAGALLYKKAAS